MDQREPNDVCGEDENRRVRGHSKAHNVKAIVRNLWCSLVSAPVLPVVVVVLMCALLVILACLVVLRAYSVGPKETVGHVSSQIQSQFALRGISDKYGPGLPFKFAVLEKSRDGERELGPVDVRRNPSFSCFEEIKGDFWLHCTLESQQVIALRFHKEGPDDPRADVHQFSLLIGDNWFLGDTHMNLLHQGVEGSWLEPAALKKGDRVRVLGRHGQELGYVQFLRDQEHFILPLSTANSFVYQLDSRDHASNQTHSYGLSYIARAHMLVHTVTSPNVNEWIIVDELTKTQLTGGRLFIGSDITTREDLAIGFWPSDSSPQLDYYLFPITPDTMANGVLRLRPHRILCSIHCTDALTNQPVANVTIECSGKAQYIQEYQQLVLPSPRAVKSLAGIELQLSSPGYKGAYLPLSSAGELIARAKGEPIHVELERTHTNIVIIWPASTGMGRVLGDERFRTPKPFIDELIAALRERCEPLGYGDIDLLVLKDNGLMDGSDLSTPSYESADMPAAVLYSGKERTQPYSIYEDVNFRHKFGLHTVVVIFLGDFNPTRASGAAKRSIMHLHLAKISREGEDDPFIKKFCEESFDKVSNLIVGDTEKMSENARKLAEDLENELRRCLGK